MTPGAGRYVCVERPVPGLTSVARTFGLVGPRSVTTHRLRATPGSLAVATRGYGAVAFLREPPARGWAFVERHPGEWLIVSTLDGRVLSLESRISCVAPRDGADVQL